ncbi:hypothetical protein [Aureibacillus halotolerans]|uniref:Uncharacterized protein n=1 Tax=Aureibacillus halotolerans TaxID=1508390 RepID=A0A4R6U5A7_9BACI|nr:hypothetical protein [Aureibacillus halotolerans]TDQ39789.1 hypothetical protein EV213_107156 [Aureibacillus halotolerans]
MEIIDRYIYAVTHRFPELQRKEIKRELQGLIEDMLEERVQSDEPTEKEVESVLHELGHPASLANQYRGYDRYVISPLMFDSYVITIKIVLLSILAALTVVFAIDVILEPMGILQQFIEYLVSLINVGAQGFAWVTIIFALVDLKQRSNQKEATKAKEWKLSELPQIPDENATIKRSDPIGSLIFTVLFTIVLLYSSELLGVWRFTDGQRLVIPFLDGSVFQKYAPLVWGIAIISILKDCVRMILRKRNGKMLVFHTVVSVIAFALVSIILTDAQIWNPDFIQQLQSVGLLTASGEDYNTVVSIWEGATEGMLLIAGLFVVLDVLSETSKWYKGRAAAGKTTARKAS